MAALPLIIAGPIVRRVEARRCTFWVALREQAQVSAHLWLGSQSILGAAADQATPGGAPLASGTGSTRRFGAKLHIAVVTIKLENGPPPLTPGSYYSYNISLQSASGTADLKSEGLLRDEQPANRLSSVDSSAPLHLALGYSENRLPSFVAPQAPVEKLRLAHASCRKTNGPSFDAMAWLDDQIKKNQDNLDERVQQLYLTGDQIYADEVGACMLPMLNELGRDILGGDENLPIKNVGFPATIANFPALRRQGLTRLEARFTSTSANNHLLSFAEYAAMYLAAWSSRVWRALADPASLFTAAPANLADVLTKWEDKDCFKSLEGWKTKKLKGVTDEKALVELYREAVPKVARALANVAVYMMMDDHEVTDDWNLNKRWRNRVLGNDLGKAIVRNGMMAAGIFQGWGNDPAAFESGNNKAFLDEAEKLTAGSGPFPAGDTTKMDNELLGLRITAPDFKKQVVWHFQVRGPRFLVVALDSRTRRTYRGEGLAPPALLGSSLKEQVPGKLQAGLELLIVVSPAPVLGPHLLDRVGQPAAQIYRNISNAAKGKDHDPCQKGGPVEGAEDYDAEGWATNEEAMEDLLARLAENERVVLLSGDVHYGDSLVMDYWKGSSAPVRFTQLTASPSRNNFKEYLQAVLRTNAMLQSFEQGLPAERLAWKGKSSIQLPASAKIAPGRRARMNREPALVPSRGWPSGTTIPADKPPDWRWRLQLVRDMRPNSDPNLPAAVKQPALSIEGGGDLSPANAIKAYNAIATRHFTAAATHFDHLRQMVFNNNIGLVSLFMSGTTLTVRHTLLSYETPTTNSGAPNTVHEISLVATSDAPPQLQE